MPAPLERQIILLIDGSIGYRAEMERAIGQVRPGTSIRTCTDGRAAIEHLLACGDGVALPHRILLSRMLPGGVDGLDVLREVRTFAQFAVVPVIMVHSDQQPEDVQRALDLGAAAWLLKPEEKGKYLEFAQEVLDWRTREEIGHELSTMLARAVSPAGEVALTSRVMSPTAVLPASNLAPRPDFLTALWGGLTAYLPMLRELAPDALRGVHVDQDAADIRYASNQARITTAEVVNLRLKEHRMQLKRRRFYAILLEREWTFSQIQTFFPGAKLDYLKKVAASMPKSRTDRALPED